jgi:hypothetical protein
MSTLGVVSAAATRLAASALGDSPSVVAGCVVRGVGVLALVRNDRLLRFTPAGFFGFASTVGTIEATGTPVTAPVNMSRPVVLVLAATVLGAGFGWPRRGWGCTRRLGNPLLSARRYGIKRLRVACIAAVRGGGTQVQRRWVVW